MSCRTVVIASTAKLDYQMGYLVIRKNDITKIHLSEVEILIIESTAVSLTAALLCELTKKKIKVIFCDEKRNPSSELIGYYGAHDTSLKIRNQIAWLDEIKKHIWTEIVTEKIRKQEAHLNYWNCAEAELLHEYIREIKFADETNREGHAAKVYFNALFGMNFTRTAESVTNAALNYGYSLLLSAFNRCVVANGYITQLGLFHDNVFKELAEVVCKDCTEKFAELNQHILYFMDEIINSAEYNLASDVDCSAIGLIKYCNVHMDTCYDSLAEQFIDYLRAMKKICGIDIVFVLNLKQYFNIIELQEIYKHCFYLKIFLINLEGIKTDPIQGDRYIILDKDQCILDLLY